MKWSRQLSEIHAVTAVPGGEGEHKASATLHRQNWNICVDKAISVEVLSLLSIVMLSLGNQDLESTGSLCDPVPKLTLIGN